MSETEADIGQNSEFGMADDKAGPFPAIAEVTAITPPGKSRDAIDATHLKSPDNYEEFISGLKKGGEAKLTLNFVPAVFGSLNAAFEAGSKWCQITFPDGATTMTFKGVITELTPPELNKDKMTATMTVKVSGKPELVLA